ncbi:MAG: hypothetical protein FJ288_09235 [Planctomycetes bacterium]|nr:hypothetical protein [Planctomycetota bacterium]
MRAGAVRAAAFLVCCAALAAFAPAGDWPMWRGDAGRTAACGEALADRLHLQWTLRLPAQVPAWKDEPAMQFDRGPEPVIADGRVFIGSTVNDSLSARRLDTGEELWRFYAGGPVRAAPAAWRDRVFAACDDGWLYALAAADGRLLWKVRGGPGDRRLVGNERLISTWPARGGPVAADGRVYFAAGVWPFMGVFVHCVDAESGRVIWTNDSTDFTWYRQPHRGAWSLAGLSPQGCLALAGERLIVPGSRWRPAVIDAKTGEFLFFGAGVSPYVYASGQVAMAGGQVFDLATGLAVRLSAGGGATGILRFRDAVLAPDAWHTDSATLDPATLRLQEKPVDALQKSEKAEKGASTGAAARADEDGDDKVPERGGDATIKQHSPEPGEAILPGTIARLGSARGTPWLRAGGRLVAGGKGGLQILDVSAKGDAVPVGQVAVEGTITSVAAAGGRLIVATREGVVHCFGPDQVRPRTHAPPARTELRPGPWAERAAGILKAAGAADGYALVWGLKDGGLVEELIRLSNFHVIAVDRDAAKVDALRRRLDAAGLYGTRGAAVVGEVSPQSFAPYWASLAASEDVKAAGFEKAAGFAGRLLHVLRPYGGAACLELAEAERAALAQEAGALPQAAGAEVCQAGRLTLVVRAGALAGAADWCGQNADAGNARAARDGLVRAPLGVLWYGNALSNSLILPRHGEGPVEQVAGGRLFIEGPDSLTAADVYTGRVLWTRRFPNLGKLYNVTEHQRGAHSIGSNFYAVPDAVYVAAGEACHALDPATGGTVREFRLPAAEGEKGPSPWQFLLIYEDLLIAGVRPIIDPEQKPGGIYSPTSSRGLAAMDRRDGRLLWSRDAAHAFRHYGIAAGGGKVFAIDRLAPEQLKGRAPEAGAMPRPAAAKERKEPKQSPRLLALDARTGAVAWESKEHVGEALSYSAEHDVLVAEAAFRGKDGTVLWQGAPTAASLWGGKWGLMICGRLIVTQGQRGYDLLTGRAKTMIGPDGRETYWRFTRSYGCGPVAGGEGLLTFRSGCAGFYDLARDGGTGNLGGFRSGCTPNLLAAGGVLNAPDYTRTCTCGYANRSSLALIHMPEAEYWTYGAPPAPGRLGVNFGAPGDRRADDGTLWQDFPAVGGPPAEMPVRVRPEGARYRRNHSSRIQGGQGPAWVVASGVEGAEEIAVPAPRPAAVPAAASGAAAPAARRFTVRLYFAEPEERKAGERVFSVAIQGKEALRDFDIVREAGGPRRGVVKEFKGVEAGGGVVVTLVPRAGRTLLCGLEIAGGE